MAKVLPRHQNDGGGQDFLASDAVTEWTEEQSAEWADDEGCRKNCKGREELSAAARVREEHFSYSGS